MKKMLNKNNLLFLVISLIIFISNSVYSSEFQKKSKIIFKENLFHDVPTFNEDGSINSIIEISSGENDKWQVSKKYGYLEWEKKNNSYRTIKYLPYPTNYGIIPQTITPKDNGGDGDPVDILILGEKFEKGSIVKVKIIGVIKMIDNGELDDKIIGVYSDSKIFNPDLVFNFSDLNQNYPGVLDIIKIWFENYKGPGQVIIKKFENKKIALEIINNSKAPYEILKGYWKNNR